MKYKLVIASILLLAGCNGSSQSHPVERDLILKTYQVPDGYQEEIRDVTNRAFRSLAEQGEVGRLEQLPNGDLVLVAPKKIHEGFAEMLEHLGTRKATGPKTATLQCWLVVGKRGDGGVSPELDDIPEVTKALKEKGITEMVLLDRLKISSNIGARAKVQGEFFQLNHVLNRIGPQWILDLRIQGMKWITSDIDTRVQLEANRFVLLGETRLPLDSGHEQNALLKSLNLGETPYLFYVIRILDSEDRM